VRAWLTDDGIAFTASDLAPALGLLEATGYVKRAKSKGNTSRAGYLAVPPGDAAATPVYSSFSDAPEAVLAPLSPEDKVRVTALAMAIVKALTAGNGRVGLCDSEAELISRLDQDGVQYDPADIPAALSLLEAGAVPGTSGSAPSSQAVAAAVAVRAAPSTAAGVGSDPVVLSYVQGRCGDHV
jgi:hypothetical protein